MTEHGCQNQIGVWALTDRGGQEGDSSKENRGDDNLTKQGPPKQKPQNPLARSESLRPQSHQRSEQPGGKDGLEEGESMEARNLSCSAQFHPREPFQRQPKIRPRSPEPRSPEPRQAPPKQRPDAPRPKPPERHPEPPRDKP